MNGRKPRVNYAYSEAYASLCDEFERCKGRASLVYSLAEAYGLFSKVNLRKPGLASEEDLREFHEADYLALLRAEEECPAAEEAGLAWDCPLREGVWRYARATVGASLEGAEALLTGHADVSVNWGGGWHHAFPDQAAGFCYANDVVLAILRLRRRFSRILYIDLDIHHGDAVEAAFAASPHVISLSFHHHSPGFFPGTGALHDGGLGNARHATLNVPLRQGLCDQDFIQLFDKVIGALEPWRPEAVVAQFGADGLSRDPAGAWNLTELSYVAALKRLLSLERPLLLLGGGGYDAANTARLWTRLTWTLVEDGEIPEDIPDEASEFLAFGPDYSLSIPQGKLRNENTPAYLDEITQLTCHKISQFLDSSPSHIDNIS